MSFSGEQKEYIINQTYRAPCCRRALVQGVLFAKGVCIGTHVSISLEKPETAEFVSRLIREFYTADVSISRDKNGGRRVLMTFVSKSAALYISKITKNSVLSKKCDNCTPSFLRGVFLASGRSSDPKSQYAIEFSLAERSEIFLEFLTSLGINSKMSRKKNGTVVYIKDSAVIEEFYALAGMNRALFSLIDAKMEGEIRRNVMRVANCETNNIEKAVNAARRQVDVISALDESNLLSSLPEELEETARLRLRYPDLSLSQLSQVSVPPISKPGLSHRLKKIVELGTQLLEHHEALKK